MFLGTHTHTKDIIFQSVVASEETVIKDDLRPNTASFQSDRRAIKEFVKKQKKKPRFNYLKLDIFL